MPYVRHEDSQLHAKPSVALMGAVPPTQASLAYQGNEKWEIFNSDVAANGTAPGDTMSWTINKSTSCTDIAESYLKITGYFVIDGSVAINPYAVTAGTAPQPFLPTSQDVSPVQMLSAAIFDDFEVTINGTVVAPSQGVAQPYVMLGNIIKNEPYAVREAGTFTKGYILDDGDYVYENSIPKNFEYLNGDFNMRVFNHGGVKRQLYYFATPPVTAGSGSSRPFTITVRLADLGLRTHGWLPPNIQAHIRVRRSQNAKLVMGPSADVTASDPQYTMTEAKLFVSRKELNHHAQKDLMAAWERQTLRVPIERYRNNITWYTTDNTSASVSQVLSGPTPSVVMAMVVCQKAINGASDGEQPMFDIGPQDGTYWTNATLQCGGVRTFPLQPVQQVASNGVRGTRDLSEVYQMYLSCCNRYPFLKSEDFFNIQPLCFQIAGDKDMWDVAEDTSITFQGTLSAAPFGADSWALVLISFTPGVVEFAITGETIVS
jgi:hypothetical protein